jgi:nanoRNase/pAp phosphatase (c-di-AMP/oligoRNAs hydrolase)
MRYFVILDTESLLYLLGDKPFRELDAHFLVGSRRLRNKISRRGYKVRCSDIADRKLYQRVHISHEDTLILRIQQPGLLKKVFKSLRSVAPEASILVLVEKEEPGLGDYPPVRQATLPSLFGSGLLAAVDDLQNQKRVNRLKNILEDADKVVILMQNDPDPDAIASGLALRALLGRNRATAPLMTLGKVERPENLAMIKLLEVEVRPFEKEYMKGDTRLVMVDVQPPYFGDMFPKVDVVIDHHPQAGKYESTYLDLRINYGATSSILTEYLKAEGTKLTQRLATALLYGIKSDTLLLDRETDPADVTAFTYLYPHTNHNLIRRIEHPELPIEGLDPFADALKNRIIKDKVLFSHMQNCAREDLIPQFADFCLQVEGIEWSVVSGLVDGNLVVSVRNVGYIRSAGEVMREAFGGLGSAGGHRAMAKAVVPLDDLNREVDTSDARALRDYIAGRFFNALNR